MASSKRKSGYGETRIKRHKISEWESYEVKKEELDILSKGGQSDKFLEFGIATASSGVSFFIAWLSIEFEDKPKLYMFYLMIFIILSLATLILIVLWLSSRKNKQSVIDEIKNRPLDEIINNT